MVADERIPIFDAHLDLAWNALSFNRDLTLSLTNLCNAEEHLTDGPFRGHATITLPELKAARLRVCVATLLARAGTQVPKQPPVRRVDLDYAHPSIARAHAYGQFGYYLWLEEQGFVRLLRSASDLEAHWKADDNGALGIIASFEGCDPITDPDDVNAWYELGVRAAGLTHYGAGQYAFGTGTNGPLRPRARELLRRFEELGIALDVTHLCDESMAEALDLFSGPVLASHHNCRALVPGDRQLSDVQIEQLITRNAVIGTAFDAWMLYPDWVRGETDRSVVHLATAADHIDHVCQIAGSAKHVALGTDLDGGFGYNQTPVGLDRYADLQVFADILRSRGYSEYDINLVFHGNWLRFFTRCLS